MSSILHCQLEERAIQRLRDVDSFGVEVISIYIAYFNVIVNYIYCIFTQLNLTLLVHIRVLSLQYSRLRLLLQVHFEIY
jgi:hypothetical protein